MGTVSVESVRNRNNASDGCARCEESMARAARAEAAILTAAEALARMHAVASRQRQAAELETARAALEPIAFSPIESEAAAPPATPATATATATTPATEEGADR
jgi:hypothetical protein